jgi:2-oxo-3-hexenedioate decarboxylase
MLESTLTSTVASQLDEAARTCRTVRPFADVRDLDTGYAVQAALIGLRTARGERVVGRKMGLTSRAKMEQMGVHAPIHGVLTDAMQVPDGTTVQLSTLIHPRVEPEVCFRLGKDLKGPVTFEAALDAIDAAAAALEIIDSRFVDFKYDLPNVVADNASAALFVVGRAWVPMADVDVADLQIRLEIDGSCIEQASSAAVYDHPVRSLMALADMLAESGDYLRAGMLVLSGAATASAALRPGYEVRGLVEALGSVTLRFA